LYLAAAVGRPFKGQALHFVDINVIVATAASAAAIADAVSAEDVKQFIFISRQTMLEPETQKQAPQQPHQVKACDSV
jgi:hypothetical protein